MSRKPRKMIEMPKDMFTIYLTWAFFIGWSTPAVFTALVLRYG